MTCLEIREKLPEFVLGVLPADEAEDVERHLEWCAGCRKESVELLEGVATVGLALPTAQPRPALESKLVGRLQAAAGRPAARPKRANRLVLALAVVTVATASLAVGATTWGIAKSRQAEDARIIAAVKSEDAAKVAAALASFHGAGAYQASLAPAGPSKASGSVAIFSAPKQDDFIFVSIVPPVPKDPPYTVRVVTSEGEVMSGGLLNKTQLGNWVYFEFTRRNLSRGKTVTIYDATGRIILQGAETAAAEH